MADQCARGGNGPEKALKLALLAFVILSLGGVAYKIAASSARTPAVSVVESAPLAAEPESKAPVKAAKPLVKAATEAKTAVVYYFYTNTRCSSCKTIETYTREAVEKNFTAGYKEWKVIFKSVNVEEEADKHFVRDYWLNSKSVVVQKFSGEKALKWAKLEKVWQLLGDKDAFVSYVAGETHKLLDEK